MWAQAGSVVWGICFNITLFCLHCRVLCKFAFSLSQDWELPIKREVSRWHLSFSHSARGFAYCLPLPALCFSPSSVSSGASSRGCGWGCFPCQGRLCSRSCVAVLAEGAACPAQLGQMEMAGSLSPVLSNPQGLSVCQLRKGGKCRKLLCLGARGLGVLGLRPQTRPPLFWVWCTDRVSVSSCRRRRRSH